jgi:hypothetical protein
MLPRMRSASGIVLPPLPQQRPWRGEGRARRMSLAMGIGVLLEPDGTVAWQDEDWQFNALHDAGEQSMLSVYLKETANVTKYLGLLNDATVAETDGTMTAVTEAATPGAQGYNRQQVVAADWTDDGLQGGDYRFSAAEKTFGPVVTTAITATHSSLSTTATGAGVLLLTLALSATTTIAVSQSFKYILRWSQS